MEFGRRLLTVFLSVICCLGMQSSLAHGLRFFAAPMGEKNWSVTESRLHCQLKQDIPGYGFAIISQDNAGPSMFTLTSFQGVSTPVQVAVVSRAPEWKEHSQKQIVQSRSRPGRIIAEYKASDVQRLISELAMGQSLHFDYGTSWNDKVRVEITGVAFQDPYDQYVKCLAQLIPFRYADVRYRAFYFGNNSLRLDEKQAEEIAAIAEYVKADAFVDKVLVTGYADTQGPGGSNMFLSQRRAQEVQKHLLALGVPEKKIRVNWVGEKSAVPDDQSDAARAYNRRVVIELLR